VFQHNPPFGMLNRSFLGILAISLLSSISLKANLAELRTTINGNDVMLSWNTSGDELSFEIEVATDADNNGDLIFTSLGEVTATGDNTCEFTDITPGKNGLRYYRVKQHKENGVIAFTETVTANFSTTESFGLNVTTPASMEKIELGISAANNGQAIVTLTSLVSAYNITEQVGVNSGCTTHTVTVDPKAPVGPYLLSLELNGDVQLRLLTKEPSKSLVVTN